MAQSSFESTQLPALEPHTHCVLIPRDPNYIYAYWDYTQQDIDSTRNKLKFESGDARLILRVYDTTANNTWDIDVGFSAKNWYIHVWQDNADYRAELGIISSKDHFISLVRSNIAHTPPKSASQRNDLIWQDIKAHKESQPYLKQAINERYQALTQKQPKHKPQQSTKQKIYHLTAQDIRAYYMKVFSGVSRKGRGRAASMEEILKRKSGSGSWQKVQPLITNLELIERIHPGSSEAQTMEQKGASENLFNLSAGASEGRLKKREFFFEIWTELIVHGRTEPDAKVFLLDKNPTTNEAIGPFDKGIKLNPDGTFSLRFALPDGEIPLKFIAQSSDAVEQRHINTRVEREKTIAFPKMLKEFHG